MQAAPLQGSGFGFCARAAGNVTGAVDAALPPSAGGVASLATFRAAARFTLRNEKCRLPVVYGCAPLQAAPMRLNYALSRSMGPMECLAPSGGSSHDVQSLLCMRPFCAWEHVAPTPLLLSVSERL
jgi:hypothetical protein